jgi:hypothetical protein
MPFAVIPLLDRRIQKVLKNTGSPWEIPYTTDAYENFGFVISRSGSDEKSKDPSLCSGHGFLPTVEMTENWYYRKI